MSQRGFTIIELMIATVVFSVVTLIITTSILQFTRQYYRGSISSSTQSVARSIVDDVTRSIQFNKAGIEPLNRSGLHRGYCVGGSKRYSFEPYKKVLDNNHGLVADTLATGCSSLTTPINLSVPVTLSTTNAREMLGERMRLAKFDISSSGDMWKVTVKVVYGDDELLTSTNSADMRCKTGSGSQFCAVSELTTTVMKRVQ